jgi:hypothetical protein
VAEDMGESIVGAYMRYVRKCDFVLFNSYLPDEQGEIDVIGLRSSPACAYVAEVTTHLGGMTYGGPGGTIAKVGAKLDRAQKFATQLFPDHERYFEIWSPRVAKGAVTQAFEDMEQSFPEPGRLTFVINERYGDCLEQLIEVARTNERATSDPAFRLLQILCRVRTTSGHRVLAEA